MDRTWSAIVIAAAGGFILMTLVFQDLRTPNAVIWEPTGVAGDVMERADGLVLQEERDGVLYASDGFSIYRSDNDRGFLKVHDVKPPLGRAYAGYSRTLRSLLGLQETIEVFALDHDRLLVFAGGVIQRVDLRSGEAKTVHRLRYHGRGEGRGVMPFGITRDAAGRIYYGEYVTRRLGEGETVALFRSDDGGESFEIVYEFPALAVRHIHAVQWDPYGQVLWMGTGEGDEQSRVGFSRDFGESFVWVGRDSRDFRNVMKAVAEHGDGQGRLMHRQRAIFAGEIPEFAHRVDNFAFAEDHVAWLSDSLDRQPRAVRWHRDDGEIETSAESLPSHGLYMQAIGDGFSIGTTAATRASLWLIGPDLALAKIMEWPPGEARMRGISALRLARGMDSADRNGSRIHLSPLRVADREPAIYRLSRDSVFALAEVTPPKKRRCSAKGTPDAPLGERSKHDPARALDQTGRRPVPLTDRSL